MNRGNFALSPFHPGETPKTHPDISIAGFVERNGDLFSINYKITGRLSGIELPGGDIPSRQDGLWDKTCLECFLAPRNSPEYWEFNLSPAGHWNVYGFDSYRKGMRWELSFEKLPFICRTGPDKLKLSLEFNLGTIIPRSQEIDAAVSAVIKTRDGRISYWALSHPSSQPDFHDRRCFNIAI